MGVVENIEAIEKFLFEIKIIIYQLFFLSKTE